MSLEINSRVGETVYILHFFDSLEEKNVCSKCGHMKPHKEAPKCKILEVKIRKEHWAVMTAKVGILEAVILEDKDWKDYIRHASVTFDPEVYPSRESAKEAAWKKGIKIEHDR